MEFWLYYVVLPAVVGLAMGLFSGWLIFRHMFRPK